MKRQGTRRRLTQDECDRAHRLYKQYGYRVASELLGISSSTMMHLQRRGFQPAKRRGRQMPNDFKIVAHGKTNDELRKHYRCSPAKIARWRDEASISGARCGIAPMPVPIDAKNVISRLGTMKASRHYGVHQSTVTKWKRSLGLLAKKPEHKGIGWVDNMFSGRVAA